MSGSRVLRLVGSLVALALLGAGCGVIGGGGTYQVVAYFPRAVSLYESGAVQVLGLPAGHVTDVAVEGNRVRVTMAISDDIPLPADVHAALVPQSLIGERRVQLFPPFQNGDALAPDGLEIPIERTIVPVEPDEALAALKEFLDSLDPEGVGRLISNGAKALDGQGDKLGSALEELTVLVGNLEENDDDIIRIAERFDDFTSTLLTREAQLADVLDDFAVLTDVLADERDNIELLVRSLAGLSVDGLDLVSEHAVRLRQDVAIVERLTSSVQTNLDGVTAIGAAGPALAQGFIDAFNEDLRAIDLRNSFGPLVQEALAPIFDGAGLDLPCIPVDAVCPAATAGATPLSGADAVRADLSTPRTPIDDLFTLLGSDTAVPSTAPAAGGVDERSLFGRFLGTFLGVGA